MVFLGTAELKSINDQISICLSQTDNKKNHKYRLMTAPVLHKMSSHRRSSSERRLCNISAA